MSDTPTREQVIAWLTEEADMAKDDACYDSEAYARAAAAMLRVSVNLAIAAREALQSRGEWARDDLEDALTEWEAICE